MPESEGGGGGRAAASAGNLSPGQHNVDRLLHACIAVTAMIAVLVSLLWRRSVVLNRRLLQVRVRRPKLLVFDLSQVSLWTPPDQCPYPPMITLAESVVALLLAGGHRCSGAGGEGVPAAVGGRSAVLAAGLSIGAVRAHLPARHQRSGPLSAAGAHELREGGQ